MSRPRKKAPVVKNYVPDIQDALVKRIDECQNVLDHLDKCPAWAVIVKDLSEQKQYIDDNWQNIAEGDPKLKELRITKLAYAHLLNIRDRYALDLETASKELNKLRNTDKEIIRDYDN